MQMFRPLLTLVFFLGAVAGARACVKTEPTGNCMFPGHGENEGKCWDGQLGGEPR